MKNIKLSDSQCRKLIEGLDKNSLHNKDFNSKDFNRSPLYIIVSKTMCEYLKKNYPNKFNF